MAEEPREVWITGVGLASSLGDGPQEHWQALTQFGGQPRLERDSYRPYSVHPMCDLDFTRQIAKKSDLRQMETWQKIGVYAAGLALENAGIAHDEALLARTHLVVAAGSGERDVGVDGQILQAIASRSTSMLLLAAVGSLATCGSGEWLAQAASSRTKLMGTRGAKRLSMGTTVSH